MFFQNSNNSVRVTDEFMKAVVEDKVKTHAITDGRVMDTYRARDLLRMIASRLIMRRPRHAIRHDGESLAYLQDHRSH